MATQTYSRYKKERNIIDIVRLKRIDITITIPVTQYVAKAGDRLTTLAWKFLGDAQYWWILAEVNDIMDRHILFGRLEANQVLLIPGKEIINKLSGLV